MKILLFMLLVSLLQGCGGSSSSNDINVPVPSWVANQFEPASKFKDYCQIPRSGVDIKGKPYPDKQGSTLLEKYWLRSWTNETYLWYDEIVDSDPAKTMGTRAYFNKLKTTALTASGKSKDRFHFAVDTAKQQKLVESSVDVGYGAKFVLISSNRQLTIKVAYVQPNSPAARATIKRGTKIISINGVSVRYETNTNTLKQGLYPSKKGQTFSFVVQDVGSTQTRAVQLTATEVSQQPVHTTKTIHIINTTNTDKVAYLSLNTFNIRSAEKQLYDAFNQFVQDGVKDLVLDLRYNGGGLLAMSSQLSYMIAGNRAKGKVFERLKFNNNINNKIRTKYQLLFLDKSLGLSTKPAKGSQLPSLNLSRVFVLSTANTCSASESLINGLRGIGVEVILIGGTTCGKPYGFLPTDNCGTTYFTIQFKGVNSKNFGDYADGFSPANTTQNVGVKIPGCMVADDFLHQLADTNEALLKAALRYRTNSSCPFIAQQVALQYSNPTAMVQAGNRSDNSLDLLNDERIRNRLWLEQRRIYTLPTNH